MNTISADEFDYSNKTRQIYSFDRNRGPTKHQKKKKKKKKKKLFPPERAEKGLSGTEKDF